MKTIQVSDEVYDFLKECQSELNTQNNRSTADVMYCIEEVKTIPSSHDYTDEFEWIDRENDCCKLGSTDEELFDSIKEDYEDVYESIKEQCIDEDGENQNIKEWFVNEIDFSDDLEQFKNSGIERVYLLKESYIKYDAPHSFFEKDAVEHLEANKHHYSSEAQVYGVCNWRSYRMNRLREILMKEIKFE